MKILLGTTNPAKVERFKGLLNDIDAELLTLKDLGITEEPRECGKTPDENARIKAEFYGRYCDNVICNDSGLYLEALPLDDARQPALNIRSPHGVRLNDDEMIAYYSALIHDIGGRTLAYYLDGIAVYSRGRVSTFVDDSGKLATLYMVDTPSEKRHAGWPLDSLSLNRSSMMYFTDVENEIDSAADEQIILGEYRQRCIDFLKTALGV